ncbi:MAG TPA: hypothetical protein VEX15_00830 [Nocardioidaceae bacterium]|nr:hypothetical protein [Nocardioidaceae bacterium]
MRRRPQAIVGATIGLTLLGAGGSAVASTDAAPPVSPAAADSPRAADQVAPIRSFATSEYGIRRPTGLAWDAASGRLVVPGDARAAGTELVSLTPAETRRTSVVMHRLPAKAAVAVDPTDGSVDALSGSSVLAATYDATGTRVVLAAGNTVVRQTRDDRTTRTPIRGVSGHRLHGIATTGPLAYTYDATTGELLGISRHGRIQTRYDASGLGLADVRGLAFAPSADATDDPSTSSLYIADAGSGKVTGQIAEATLAPTAVPTIAATGSLVRTVATSAFNPPSPDPSGVAYIPGADRLFIADGEVDEMSIFQGKNLFRTTRTGTLDDTGVSQPWSDEPVGVGYNPTNNHLLVSDDDQKEIFDIAPGGDGRYGTPDDTVTHFDTNAFGNTDPEGVEFDAATGSIWTVDGVNTQVYRYRPGPDGQFGTSDDIRSNFDVGVYGARDPEGIGFDSVRDTLVIVDDGSETIYELDRSGALLNTISTTVANMEAAAGVAVAPGSTNPTARTYYVVARGEDNDSHPTENDGRLYELSASLPPVGSTNQPPLVSAGPDQTITLPASVALDGTVTDDGKPSPPGAVTTSWTKISGPGVVTFGNPAATDTSASFSTHGTYVLRLAASDSQLTTADEITVLVLPEGSPNTVEARVATGSDDAEQAVSGSTSLTSSDLELTTDGSTQQVVGTRFTGLQIPTGATITNAYVQFRTDEVSTGAAALTIRAEASNSAPTYQAASGNITSRPVTTANVAWSPPAWNTVNEIAAAQRTPNIAAVVQAIVDRAGWTPGNALALQFSGTGRRTAEAYESGAALAPLLHVEYSTGPATNRAPTVNAGPDQTVVLPNAATLDAIVTDDGLPTGSSVNTTWSVVSGPGAVTFGNPNAVDTTATLAAAGTYVLRLTASDGELTAFDETTITATPTGTVQTLNIPVRLGSDDAEERYNGEVLPSSSDLDITADGSRFMTAVGLRFTNVTVPQGATLTNAYIQFTADETGTDTANLTLRAQAADNPPTFQATTTNLSTRPTTAGSVAWAPPAWTTVGAAGTAQRTPNLASMLQAVVNRAGWVQGNAVVLLIRGTGDRTAEAFEGAHDPVLHLEWQP